jgi:hypothetical protein
MGRNRRRHAPSNGLQPRKLGVSKQLSLDPWLRSIGEASDTVNHDGLASSSSAVDNINGVAISGQEASSSQDTTAGMLQEPNQVPPDVGSNVHLETDVINTDGTPSAVTRAISKYQVVQEQKIISDARDKSEDKQKTAICNAIQLLYPYPPRDGQRDALHYLIYHRKDLVLIATTSFGKSMILQAVSVLLDKSMSIVILPLDQIGKEQAEYIERIGGRPYFLNADTISNKLLKDVADAKYTHILMSPELAVSQRLRKTILEPKSKGRLSLVVVVDEAHLVSQWGVKFRTEYSRLNFSAQRLIPRYLELASC